MRGDDSELFKDKIEVSLDGRQIFYLFFGGAVIASLVFVLGVMVGKRLESRSHVAAAAQTSTALDPLAALDQLEAGDRDDDLVFRAALTGDPETRSAAMSDVDRGFPKAEPAEPAPPAKPKPPEPEPESEPEVAAPPAPEPKPEPAKPAAKPAPAAKAKFTLQLSSFQDRAEAEAFHRRIAAAGYDAYIVEADVPDKGIWYRVRLGSYLTHPDALAAKAEFERDQKIIAYVTRL